MYSKQWSQDFGELFLFYPILWFLCQDSYLKDAFKPWLISVSLGLYRQSICHNLHLPPIIPLSQLYVKNYDQILSGQKTLLH
jgi:hypothetical protein